MSKYWTQEQREQQAKAIHRWKPWKSAGVKTAEGKERSKMNALKHGEYSAEAKARRRKLNAVLREAGEMLRSFERR
ncbi:hypothetical protein NB639_09190 [Oxalobacter formigenes]|uniref:hypothetical protein n=1 Tax=Oxalobacter formigenes TaxID=847 RepID=UPI0022B04CC1|nr:hypothetical protein [Oxalobacter formigenes]WAW05476.1 hypothetical protein NB639_09190 [Oxalobacter formigenes]